MLGIDFFAEMRRIGRKWLNAFRDKCSKRIGVGPFDTQHSTMYIRSVEKHNNHIALHVKCTSSHTASV